MLSKVPYAFVCFELHNGCSNFRTTSDRRVDATEYKISLKYYYCVGFSKSNLQHDNLTLDHI